MTDTYVQCPKCGHRPGQPLPESEPCPACGIYVFKWKAARATPSFAVSDSSDEEYAGNEDGLIASLFQPLEKIDALAFYGRLATLVLLAIWSWFLFGYDYRYGEINGSFMHNILLPIHEAGHVLFRPFGEFMTILGGSLFQLGLPFAIGVAFIVKHRDNFGAAIAMWWASVSLVDLSPYIYDALRPQLILLGGRTGEAGGHDWIYLLSILGQLGKAQFWGGFAHVCGGLLMFATLVWAGIVLWRSRDAIAGQTHADD